MALKAKPKPAPVAPKSPKELRVEKIRELQKLRGSNVVTYITNTRPGAEVQMALDVVRYVFEQLEAIRKAHAGAAGKPKIDLFIHSNGGDGTVPWRLVTLLREYTDHFGVLVPNRAFSAATLTALGADEIVMHQMGMLGPTDATVANMFNPVDPANPQRKLGISVEDVTAYIQLVKEDAGIQHEDELIQAFNLLASNVHPLALGNVKRSMSQSRMMARKLLELHIDSAQRHKIGEIVDNLTSKLFFHGHPINRKEAREQIGISTVIDASDALEKAIWELYLLYESEMQLIQPFDPVLEFGKHHDILAMNPGDSRVTAAQTLHHVLVESEFGSSMSRDEIVLSGMKQPTGSLAVTVIKKNGGWISI